MAKERAEMNTLWFAKAKDSGLDQQTMIFEPIIGPFRYFVDISRVWVLRENTLCRVYLLFFFNHSMVFDFVPFYFGFGADIEDLAH